MNISIRQPLPMYASCFFAAFALGFAKFFFIEVLVRAGGHAPSLAQGVGMVVTMGPILAYGLAPLIIQRVGAKWSMVFSMCAGLALLLASSLLNWPSGWLLFGLGSTAMGLYAGSRQSCIVPLALQWGKSVESVSGPLAGLFVLGLLVGSPCGAASVGSTIGAWPLVISLGLACCFSWMVSLDQTQDHAESEPSQGLLNVIVDTGEVFCARWRLLSKSSLVWALGGVWSLEVTGILIQGGIISSTVASAMGGFAALGMMAGSIWSGGQHHRAAMLLPLSLLWVSLLCFSVYPLMLWATTPATLISVTAINFILAGFGFGVATNLMDAKYLEECEGDGLTACGASLHSAVISVCSVFMAASILIFHFILPQSFIFVGFALIAAGPILFEKLSAFCQRYPQLWMTPMCWAVRSLLSLRYSVTIKGSFPEGENSNALWLPNHPALIDPIILAVHLWPKFGLRPVVTESFYAMLKPFRWALKPIDMPDLSLGGGLMKVRQIQKKLETISDTLSESSVLMYPAGRLMRSEWEDCGRASGTHWLTKQSKDMPVVLLRTSGLWGSRFSTAVSGRTPDFVGELKTSLIYLLKHGLLFAPRRKVTIELESRPEGLPDVKTVAELNEVLNDWYRKGIEETRSTDSLTTTVARNSVMDEETREAWEQRGEMVLASLPKAEDIGPLTHISDELNMDSIESAEWLMALSEEAEVTGLDMNGIETLGDVAKALLNTNGVETAPVDMKQKKSEHEPAFPEGTNSLLEAFLHRSSSLGKQEACRDAVGDPLDWQTMRISVLALARTFKDLPGERVGVMLPACKSAGVVALALMMAGKIGVWFNWTMGEEPLGQAWKASGANVMLTSQRLIDRLPQWPLESHDCEWVFLEEWGPEKIGPVQKIWAWCAARLPNECLMKRMVTKTLNHESTACILFTSGSESAPKGVPLTHGNVLANIQACTEVVELKSDDTLLGFLPPFHSFGFMATTMMPLLTGIRTIYHSNPMDSKTLVRLVEQGGVSLAFGTPTFLQSMFRVAKISQLSSLRLLVAGAEKVPLSLRDSVAQLGKKVELLEGYGITECSPVLTLQRPDSEPIGVGRPLSSVQLCIVDPESKERLPQGERGLILASGPSIFSGYLDSSKNPFLELDGQTWYNTGDLGVLQEGGHLVLSGRMKRFVKIAGEMISLPALEEALRDRWPASEDGPVIAVEALESEEKVELVCLGVEELTLEDVNRCLKDRGFSNLCRMRRWVKLDSMPQLGSGKVDYVSLKELLKEGEKVER